MNTSPSGARWYNAVWRWHFYAGLLCIPMVIWLALTGTVYLWRPQIEGWLDRRYDHLSTAGPVASPSAQAAAAVGAVPGSHLHKYILPERPDQAVRILVMRDGVDTRVYVDPRTTEVLGTVVEEDRPLRVVMQLHGQLLAGDLGSYVVEIAACWAVVMLITGVYLWWPRGRTGLAGVLYPRLRRGRRLFWRDIHACAGIWCSAFALVLILTGLPWAKAWGSYLDEVRQVAGLVSGPVDWTIAGKPAGAGMHAGHQAMPAPAARLGDLDRVIRTAGTLDFAPPVAIEPPRFAGKPWTATSDAANRPLRGSAEIDGMTGRLVGRTGFADRHWIDRAVGYGIAVHEGALFGLANQLLGTLTALLLVVLAMSGAVMWWRRRPSGLLGAPLPLTRPRFGAGLVAAIVLLGLYMPMFGATLLLVLLVEATVLRRLPGTRRWLGLSPCPA